MDLLELTEAGAEAFKAGQPITSNPIHYKTTKLFLIEKKKKTKKAILSAAWACGWYNAETAKYGKLRSPY